MNRLKAIKRQMYGRTHPGGDGHRQLANLRDLGGLRLTGGGLTQRGVLCRGDAPYPGDDVPTGGPQWPRPR